jgi:cell division septation protein DedD
VEARKVNDAPAPVPESEPAPIVETPKTEEEPVKQEWTPIFDPPPVYNEEPEEPEEEPRGGRPWVIILLIVIIGLLCFGVAYQFRPEWFGKQRPVDTTIIVNGPPPAAKQPDTTKAAQKDTTVKSPQAQPAAKTALTQPAVSNAQQGLVIDSTKSHWEVFLSAFKTKTRANEEIEKYKAAGIPAFISPDAKGKLLIKIIAGSYDTEADAEKAKNDLIKTGKVPKNIYSLEIKPRKIK